MRRFSKSAKDTDKSAKSMALENLNLIRKNAKDRHSSHVTFAPLAFIPASNEENSHVYMDI